MNTITTPIPIVREHRIKRPNGRDFIVANALFGDSFNLTSGVIKVARLVAGLRYDTAQATLIVGHGKFNGYCYNLWRLYRCSAGDFFVLRMQWGEDVGFAGPHFITPIGREGVLGTARGLLESEDVPAFLRNWYATGWLPRDDSYVQEWTANLLTADEGERLAAIMGPPVVDVSATRFTGSSVMPCR